MCNIGRFGWKKTEECYLPYIVRIINDKHMKFVSVRMAETHLAVKYLRFLHANIFKCASVKSHFITESEAYLLNDININHCNGAYGIHQFVAGKEYIACLEDVCEFYKFIELCYKKLMCNVGPDYNDKCGFIRINSESVVPYTVNDGQKYLPLFFFEGKTENLMHTGVKIKNWSLTYLKFCFKVQGIREELITNDFLVSNIDNIKAYFPLETNYEEYWPAKVVDTNFLLANQNSIRTNPSGIWIRAPDFPAKTIPQTSTVIKIPKNMPTGVGVDPQVVPPQQNIPLITNVHHGWQANQIVCVFIYLNRYLVY